MRNIKEPSLKIREEIDPIMFHLFSNVTAIEWQERARHRQGLGRVIVWRIMGTGMCRDPLHLQIIMQMGTVFNPWSPSDGLNDIQIVDLMETDAFHTLLYFRMPAINGTTRYSFLLWWIWIHGTKREKNILILCI